MHVSAAKDTDKHGVYLAVDETAGGNAQNDVRSAEGKSLAS